jgi:LysM repeat protein
MNNPNPFIPQGSLLEQKNRKRTRFQVAVFTIFAVNILVITPMLIQGCKRETPPDTSTTATTPVDTGALPPAPAPDTNNTATALPPPPTNPVVAPPPQQAVPPPVTATEYVIVKGDTLDSIHKKFSVSVKAIEEANPGVVPTKLHPGQKLQIPAATASTATSATVAPDGSEIYVVKAGDYLSRIASSHGTTVKAIQALNKMTTTRIKVGEKLKMPAPKASATPPPPAAVTPAPAAPAPAAPAPATQ